MKIKAMLLLTVVLLSVFQCLDASPLLHRPQVHQKSNAVVTASAAQLQPIEHSQKRQADFRNFQEVDSPVPAQPPPGNVRCQRVRGNDPGAYRFQCEIIRQEFVTLRYEHILWLPGSSIGAPAVEVIVPNYKVEEVIKAGFKHGGGNYRQPINILLQRPEKLTNAEVQVPPANQAVEPVINIQYEPPSREVVHYPNDKNYRPLSGPLVLPPRGF